MGLFERIARIARELRFQGKTQVEVARILGVSRKSIDNWDENITNASTCIGYISPDYRVKIPKDTTAMLALHKRPGRPLSRKNTFVD